MVVTDGKLYRIGIDRASHPKRLVQLWASRPGEAPDGFAVSAAGHVYVALSGPTGNAVAEVAPNALGTWREVWRTALDPTWDTPTSAQFLGDRLIVTNQAYFTGNSAHWQLLDVAVGETGAAHYVPRGAGS
jgi:sugar lactone lactonase YvrE